MMMSIQQTAFISDHTLASADSRDVIHSRFGEIVIDTRNALEFPKGLLGIPLAQHFVLANFPSEKMQQFKLLQCLDDTTLSFICLPLALENPILRREDALTASLELGIRPESLVILMIVCVHRTAEGTKLSVNARAPVFIDAERKVGAQHVFTQDHYKVQHFIN
jgi:flagellar assembly factor FliW